MSRITMLGTGNAMCTRCYNTCFVLRTDAGCLMVDAGGGNGIFRQLFRAGVPVEYIRHLFVTHCHTDHIMGVVWMIRRIAPMIYKGKFEAPFTIYCHDEARDALLTMCRLMMPEKITRALGNSIILQEVKHGDTFAVDDMTVTFFDIGSDKAKQFGFSAVTPEGKRVVCLGDEPFNPSSAPFVRDADWLLSEAFCLYRDREQFKPYEKFHSTALDAARVAQEMNVKNLLLYHSVDARLTARRQSFTAEAATAFQGNIAVPDDLETVQL